MSRRDNWCYCHTCKRSINSLGVMMHRKAHRVRGEDCKITYSSKGTIIHRFSERKEAPTKWRRPPNE